MSQHGYLGSIGRSGTITHHAHDDKRGGMHGIHHQLKRCVTFADLCIPDQIVSPMYMMQKKKKGD